MANIEFIQGSESHSSNWGKYFVKGLEAWQCKESSAADRHQSYQEYQCNDVPSNTVFTVFEQSGDKRGCNTFVFSICVATDAKVGADTAAYGGGKIIGNFEILAQAATPTKAPRLMNWWIDTVDKGDLIEFARHCAAYINKRGCKNLPPIKPTPDTYEPTPEPIKADIEKLIKKYGLEEVWVAVQSRYQKA